MGIENQGRSLKQLDIGVLVPKKDERIRMYVNFSDLNEASLEDDFLLFLIDLLEDNTVGHWLFCPYGCIHRNKSK